VQQEPLNVAPASQSQVTRRAAEEYGGGGSYGGGAGYSGGSGGNSCCIY